MSTDLVTQNWRTKFGNALIERGASATVIDERIVEVEAYCRDSGESAERAFGPAVAYANSLDRSTLGAGSERRQWAFFVGGALCVGSFLVLAFTAMKPGSGGVLPPTFPWRWGAMLGGALAAAAWLLIPLLRARGLTTAVTTTVMVGGPVLGAILGWSLPQVIGHTATKPPVWVFLALFVAGVAIVTVSMWRAVSRDRRGGPVFGRGRLPVFFLAIVSLNFVGQTVSALLR